MKKIWKFPLRDTRAEQLVEMPKGTKILCMQLQDDVPTLWGLVVGDSRHGPPRPREMRRFVIIPTGREVESGWEYVGTFIDSEQYVGHVFEVKHV